MTYDEMLAGLAAAGHKFEPAPATGPSLDDGLHIRPREKNRKSFVTLRELDGVIGAIPE